MRFPGHRRNITCRDAVALITDYLEDVLAAGQRADLQRHLAACPHCREYLAQLRATILATARTDTHELDPRTRQDLLALYRTTRP